MNFEVAAHTSEIGSIVGSRIASRVVVILLMIPRAVVLIRTLNFRCIVGMIIMISSILCIRVM